MIIPTKHVIVVAVLCYGLGSSAAYAWDGYDYDRGSSVEIEQGNLVRSGRDIEYYDYRSGQYRYGTVESINPGLGTVDVEVYDHSSGQYRNFEMDAPRSSGGLPSLPSLPALPSLPGLPGLP